MKSKLTIKNDNGFKMKRSGFKDFFSIMWSNKMSRTGLIILLFFILISILGPLILEAPKIDYANRIKPPSLEHPLGTDYSGKDILVQLILGSQDVLLVATYAAIFSVFFACLIGIVSGYVGGKTDDILMLFSNIVITIPSFPIMMILSMVLQIKNQLAFGLLLSIWAWAGLAKAIRSQVLLIKTHDFIEASKILNISRFKIITNDILPNVFSYIVVNFISIMKNSITASVSLMYLGLVPFKGNHWGMMIQLALTTTGALLGSSSILYFLAPVICIIVFQLGCYFFATGLDEALNPRLRR